MTIYQQIQKALDWGESKLFSSPSLEKAAGEAGMSARSFSSWFWAVTGFTYADYLLRRRLTEGMKLLDGSERQVIDIALEVDYRSHEAFSRAFKDEYGISPILFRKNRPGLKGMEKLNLIKEMYMGVVIKELPEMAAAAFTGFAPDPEDRAREKRDEWLKARPARGKPLRIFGYNVDAQGQLDCEPENSGYKFLVCLSDPGEADGAPLETIKAGRFAVTGVEGTYADAGTFIPAGWGRMNEMIAAKGFKTKQPVRWFEEELEPSLPGKLRLDLYLEIE